MSIEPELIFKSLCVVIFLLIGWSYASVRTDGEIDNIEKHMCAFRFFEDGSAIPEIRDNVRFACMERARS